MGCIDRSPIIPGLSGMQTNDMVKRGLGFGFAYVASSAPLLELGIGPCSC